METKINVKVEDVCLLCGKSVEFSVHSMFVCLCVCVCEPGVLRDTRTFCAASKSSVLGYYLEKLPFHLIVKPTHA